MNREDIIRMAREAGFVIDEASRQYQPKCIGFTHYLIDDELERFAALVAAASEDKWKQAVISELVCCHIYNAAHDNDPRKALHDAISWNVQVALDPQVSSDAQALIDRGADAEREIRADALTLLNTIHMGNESTRSQNIIRAAIRKLQSNAPEELAAAIRARGQA